MAGTRSASSHSVLCMLRYCLTVHWYAFLIVSFQGSLDTTTDPTVHPALVPVETPTFPVSHVFYSYFPVGVHLDWTICVGELHYLSVPDFLFNFYCCHFMALHVYCLGTCPHRCSDPSCPCACDCASLHFRAPEHYGFHPCKLRSCWMFMSYINPHMQVWAVWNIGSISCLFLQVSTFAPDRLTPPADTPLHRPTALVSCIFYFITFLLAYLSVFIKIYVVWCLLQLLCSGVRSYSIICNVIYSYRWPDPPMDPSLLPQMLLQ